MSTIQQTKHHKLGRVPPERSQMLDQVIGQLMMSSLVSDFLTHGQESGPLSRNLVIDIRKRTLLEKRLIIVHRICALILNDHVVHDHACHQDLPHLSL